MTIHDLNDFLNKKMIRSRTREIPLKQFSGQRMAFDGSNWAFILMAGANKAVTSVTNVAAQEPDRDAIIRKWHYMFLERICILLNHGITPGFIFDGINLPQKANTQKKRKDSKEDAKREIKELKKKLKECSPLDRSPIDIARLKQLMSQINYISRKEISSLMSLLKGIGIPTFKAKGEAEQLCSALAREGMVSAVFSEDSDNLAYGCPILITSMAESYYDEEEKRYYKMATCVVLDEILEDLEMDHDTFLDFCIMCGCDFNERIFRHGPVKAFNYIKQYGSLDELEKAKIVDMTCLDYQTCRQIFSHCKPQYWDEENDEMVNLIPEDLVVDKGLFYRQGEEILTSYDAEDYYRRFYSIYNNLPDPNRSIYVPPRRKVIRIRRKQVEEDTRGEEVTTDEE